MTKSTIPKDAWGVCWSPRVGYSMHMPDAPPAGATPKEAMALLGALARLERDPTFRTECADWLTKAITPVTPQEKSRTVEIANQWLLERARRLSEEGDQDKARAMTRAVNIDPDAEPRK